MKLYEKVAHRQAVLALYRALIRHSKTSNIVLQPSNAEYVRYLLDPKLYVQYLNTEWKYNLKREFERHYTDYQSFAKAFMRGVETEQTLARSNNAGDTLIDITLEYRKRKFQEQKWRENFLARKHDIQKQEDKLANELELRKKDSKIKKPLDRRVIFDRLQNYQKSEVIATELQKGKEYSDHLLRRFLKLKQKTHELPNPGMLPNTPDVKEFPIYKNRYGIPSSTKHDLINLAYDKEYIDSILKPSLEYDINKFHYLKQLKQIVNEKGPYKVKVATTSAGPIPMPYIKLPFPRLEKMKEIALDTRKLWTLIRMRNVWVSEPGSVKDEKMYPDGRYSIIGSKGFGPEEFVYPRSHYQNWAESEALWEYLMDKEIGKLRSFSSYVSDWTEHLDINTRELQTKVDEYFTKYSQLRNRNSSLQKERDALQEKMNVHYDNLVKTYLSLMKELDSNRVFKHSEIVSGNTVSHNYHHFLSSSKEKGIPEFERIGMGKQLADYLQEAGLKNFKWGMEFYKRFKFDIKKT